MEWHGTTRLEGQEETTALTSEEAAQESLDSREDLVYMLGRLPEATSSQMTSSASLTALGL